MLTDLVAPLVLCRTGAATPFLRSRFIGRRRRSGQCASHLVSLYNTYLQSLLQPVHRAILQRRPFTPWQILTIGKAEPRLTIDMKLLVRVVTCRNWPRGGCRADAGFKKSSKYTRKAGGPWLNRKRFKRVRHCNSAGREGKTALARAGNSWQ